MNVIRPSAVRHFGQPVVFTVRVVRVMPEWALIIGTAVQPDGSPVDYTKSPAYKENPSQVRSELDAGVLSTGVVALLRRNEKQWRIVTISFDAMDAPWVAYDQQYGAPSSLIGPLSDEEKAR